MLEKLLGLVAQGGVRSQNDLAQELKTTPLLLGQAIEELVRMGCLKPLAQGCDGGCDRCPLGGHCLLGDETQVWFLTEKGTRMAKKVRR